MTESDYRTSYIAYVDDAIENNLNAEIWNICAVDTLVVEDTIHTSLSDAISSIVSVKARVRHEVTATDCQQVSQWVLPVDLHTVPHLLIHDNYDASRQQSTYDDDAPGE
jgi:hypothetical protein